jgi:hypothetical protein
VEHWGIGDLQRFGVIGVCSEATHRKEFTQDRNGQAARHATNYCDVCGCTILYAVAIRRCRIPFVQIMPIFPIIPVMTVMPAPMIIQEGTVSIGDRTLLVLKNSIRPEFKSISGGNVS